MIDLSNSVENVADSIVNSVISGDHDQIEFVAKHAVAGFKAWQASKKHRNDPLGTLLQKTILALYEESAAIPAFDEIVSELWRFDRDDGFGTVMEIQGPGYGSIVVWEDDQGIEHATSFTALKKRIDRMIRKLHLGSSGKP